MKKWLLRILVAFCVMIGSVLLMLNIVSGTSETQKRGLEQAFSQIFGGTARFNKLVAFNLFPQFALQISGLEISGLPAGADKEGLVRAEEVNLVFGSEDLFFKTRLIERFDLKNMGFSEGVYFPLQLDIANAGIFPGNTKGEGKFTFSGSYGERELAGEVVMISTGGATPKYGLTEENKFTMNIGVVQASGTYVPYQKVGGEIKNLSFFAAKKGGSQVCELPETRIFSSAEYFKEVLAEFVAVTKAEDFNRLCKKLRLPPPVPSDKKAQKQPEGKPE